MCTVLLLTTLAPSLEVACVRQKLDKRSLEIGFKLVPAAFSVLTDDNSTVPAYGLVNTTLTIDSVDDPSWPAADKYWRTNSVDETITPKDGDLDVVCIIRSGVVDQSLVKAGSSFLLPQGKPCAIRVHPDGQAVLTRIRQVETDCGCCCICCCGSCNGR